MTSKTLVKHFLELTETSLTEKQAIEASEIIKEEVKKEFLEALEKAENKLDFLNNNTKKWFWSYNDHSESNWFYNFNRIHDSIIKKKWDLVKEKLGIEKFQIVEISGKEYETYLHLLLAKEEILTIVKKGATTEYLSRWEKLPRLREITPLKKSIFKKNGEINRNSEIYKKIELSKTSKKFKLKVKRDIKHLKKIIFLFKEKVRETKIEKGRYDKYELELKLNENILGILWLKERKF